MRLPRLLPPILPLLPRLFPRLRLPLLVVLLGTSGLHTAAQTLSLEDLPRPTTPPPERGPVVPEQVLRWRQEATALEHGDGTERDPVWLHQPHHRPTR